MGRIKGKHIKRTTEQLIDKYDTDFETDFEKNKKKVEKYVDMNKSKKIRNTIAGFITRIKRKER